MLYQLKKKTKEKNKLLLFSIMLFVMFIIINMGILNNYSIAVDHEYYDYELNGINFMYYIEDNEAKIVSITGQRDVTNIEIPESINGIPVTTIEAIGVGSIYNADKIIMSKNIVNVEQSALYDLSSIKFSEISVSEENEKYCSDEMGILFDKNKTELVKFPTSNTATSYSIPGSISKIGYKAFGNCENLKSITIPNSVTNIGGRAFEDCRSLETITLPIGVTTIEENTFDYCTSLTNIELHDGITNIGDSAFRYCESLESVIIPPSVTNIENSTFQCCENLKSVVIPDSVTKIGSLVFERCVSLKEIVIPANVTKIGDDAFSGYLKTIYGYKNSYAETYASVNNIEFKIIGEEPTPEKETSELIEGDFYCEHTYFSKEYGFKYRDDYFLGKATEYNQHLATMSLCLAYSAYAADSAKETKETGIYKDEDRNVRYVLEQCGFYVPKEGDSKEEQKRYQAYHYNEETEIDNVANIITSKSLGENKPTIIVIAVRGGGYGKEWGSNFTVGKTGDHKGFSDAANIVYKRLEKYISENNIEGDIKIWITGFSRAGATSNLLAAKLDDLLIDGSANIGNAKYTKEDIYAYCFATPAGADISKNPNSKKYNNIFSIVHYHDPVPLVAPEFWGFDRYGKTYIFPFKESLKKSSTYENNMLKRLDEMGYYYEIRDFRDYFYPLNQDSMGTYLRKVVKALQENGVVEQFLDGVNAGSTIKTMYYRKGFGSRKNYVNNGLQDEMRTLLGKDSMTVNGFINALFNVNEGIFLLMDLHPFLVETGTQNATRLVKAHATPAYYLAWMQSMDDYYVDGAETHFTNGTGRLLRINCPVDVYVYDSENSLVTSIVNEEPQENTDNSIISSIDENGQKIIYLPKDEDYTIKTVAREDCKTTITIDEYTGVSSDTSKIISYKEIEMKDGEELIATATKFDGEDTSDDIEYGTESGAIYTLKKSGEEISPSINLSANEIDNYTYTVITDCNEEQGEVIGGGVFTIGEFCQITATSNPGYIFDGWYVDDNKISDEKTYRFAVDENVLYVAKFIKCEHNEENELVNITPATLTENGNITYVCSECEEEINEIIYYPEVIQLSEYAYTYDGTEKTPTVSVIDSNGNIVDESNYKVEYSDGRINAGDYTVKIVFEGNYSGVDTKTYTINRKEITPTIADIPDETYTSEIIEPEIIMKDEETVLIKDVDYTLDYANNVDVGTATIKYNSVDESNYDVGTGEITFEIVPYTLFMTNISLESTSYRVTGEEIKPEITVIANGKTLEKDKDYELEYKNNIDVDTNSKVIVKGKGNYNGTAIAFFSIVPKEVLKITGIETNQTIEYSGLPVELEGIAKINSDLIPENVEFEVTWYNVLGKEIKTPTNAGNYICVYKYEDADYIASLTVNVTVYVKDIVEESTELSNEILEGDSQEYTIDESKEERKNESEETKSDSVEQKNNIKETIKSPQTGDNIVLLWGIMIVAIISLVGIIVYDEVIHPR